METTEEIYRHWISGEKGEQTDAILSGQSQNHETKLALVLYLQRAWGAGIRETDKSDHTLYGALPVRE